MYRNMPVDLVLVRHGQSEGNLAQKLSRKGDFSKIWNSEFRERHNSLYRLTDKGRMQAKIAGTWIKQHISKFFDKYFTSEYIRAIETAGMLSLLNARWATEMYLRERDRGILANQTHHERETHHPEEMRRKERDGFYWQPSGGESIANLCLRVDRVIENLCENCSGLRVIIVCHGGVIKSFRTLIEKVGSSDQRRTEKIHNCQILWYSRRDPVTGYISSKYNWVVNVCPWNLSLSSNNWREIKRHVYSNEELLRCANQVLQLVDKKIASDKYHFDLLDQREKTVDNVNSDDDTVSYPKKKIEKDKTHSDYTEASPIVKRLIHSPIQHECPLLSDQSVVNRSNQGHSSKIPGDGVIQNVSKQYESKLNLTKLLSSPCKSPKQDTSGIHQPAHLPLGEETMDQMYISSTKGDISKIIDDFVLDDESETSSTDESFPEYFGFLVQNSKVGGTNHGNNVFNKNKVVSVPSKSEVWNKTVTNGACATGDLGENLSTNVEAFSISNLTKLVNKTACDKTNDDAAIVKETSETDKMCQRFDSITKITNQSVKHHPDEDTSQLGFYSELSIPSDTSVEIIFGSPESSFNSEGSSSYVSNTNNLLPCNEKNLSSDSMIVEYEEKIKKPSSADIVDDETNDEDNNRLYDEGLFLENSPRSSTLRSQESQDSISDESRDYR